MFISFQEPSNKRVKPVAKSNSLTGVITPVKTPALKRIGQSISVTMHKHAHTPVSTQNEKQMSFCTQAFSRSALFTAVHQFSHRGPTFAPGPPALPHEGLVISTPAQQPVLEWHRGEPWPHREGDQTSRGARTSELSSAQPQKLKVSACVFNIKRCVCVFF